MKTVRTSKLWFGPSDLSFAASIAGAELTSVAPSGVQTPTQPFRLYAPTQKEKSAASSESRNNNCNRFWPAIFVNKRKRCRRAASSCVFPFKYSEQLRNRLPHPTWFGWEHVLGLCTSHAVLTCFSSALPLDMAQQRACPAPRNHMSIHRPRGLRSTTHTKKTLRRLSAGSGTLSPVRAPLVMVEASSCLLREGQLGDDVTLCLIVRRMRFLC